MTTIRAAILGIALTLLSACALPLTESVGPQEFDPESLPLGALEHSCYAEDGALLRGLYLPVEGSEELILHLLPRSVSTTAGLGILAGFNSTLEIFRHKGTSSLVLDYRGVGASPGELDPEKVAMDALAMWKEALRLVDGDSNRIVIRAASLGTLATSAILHSGARPKAMVVTAPLNSKSLVSKVTDEEFGSVLGAVVAIFFNNPDIAGFEEVIRDVHTPTLVLSATEDLFCNSEEVCTLLENAADNVTHVQVEGPHEALVARFWGFALTADVGEVAPDLLPSEQEFWRRHIWNDSDQTSNTPPMPDK